MSRLYNLWELIKMDYVINIKNEEILMNLKIQKNMIEKILELIKK